MTLRMTILGCGSSGGVPRIGGDWGVCDPQEPKNRRTRCSVLLEQWKGEAEPPQKERTMILVDTSPDLREQLLKTATKRLDALLFTHEHADQTHGIDDVRALAYRMGQRIPTYMDAHTKPHVVDRFSYLFEKPEGRVHPPILDLQPLLSDGETVRIDGPGGVIKAEFLSVSHGPTASGGFLFNDKIAYTPDVWGVSDKIVKKLSGVDAWVIDALRYNEHPTHAHADRAMKWIAGSAAKQGILTNLHIDMDYQTLCDELPGQHCAGFDGMQITA
ncbi:MAG: MBL fold metallo-hydrolase [Hellea sp.]|nr:MBL fold metallo-hydrolase [Hellea sp.]